MGIRNLNRFLREHCLDSIRCIDLSELRGKRIAVDISIYLYKYEKEEQLLENMYLMFATLNYYGIMPIFIFDGKAPEEKQQLLSKRKEDRDEAQKEYNKLKEQLTKCNTNDDKQEIQSAMDMLKMRLVKITKEQIEKVKALIRAFGLTYFDAPGEADELCAMLVIKKKAWACLSEDMDLFVYGCPRVLRYLSLLKHKVVLYYTTGILNTLQMSVQEFKEICVLSGTDYNINTDENMLESIIKYFNQYKIEKCNKKFYDWLMENTDYIKNMDLLNKIINMFNINFNKEKLNVFKNIKIESGPIRRNEIVEIMKEADFVFPSANFSANLRFSETFP